VRGSRRHDPRCGARVSATRAWRNRRGRLPRPPIPRSLPIERAPSTIH
jgi:hypothetical protein